MRLQTVSSKNGAKSLQEFCRDLCEAASKNTIDPVSVAFPQALPDWQLVWTT